MLRSEWDQLPTEAKMAYTHAIEARVDRAVFQQIAQFSAVETAVFVVEGEEFVYIPADEAMIGWDPDTPTPQSFLDLLAHECDIMGQEDLDEELRQSLSPRRPAQCREMLVERYMSEVWWEKGGVGLPISNGLVVARPDGGSDYELVGLIVDALRPLGWDILTEDEWEYLAGGTYPTILAPEFMEKLAKDPTCVKSNSMSAYAIRNRHWRPCPGGALGPGEGFSATLNVLNGLGLWLNQGGPNEVVNARCVMKNGDGAGASCGGYQGFDALAASPHFRCAPPGSKFVYPLEFFCLRRIVPLDAM